MKYPFFVHMALLVTLLFPLGVFAQANIEDIVGASSNKDAMLSRIYASDVTITSPANDQNVTGTFVMRNSEDASVGGIQYEVLLLDPLKAAPIGKLIADAPNVYDRVRSTEVFVMKAGEKRTIPFTYHALNVPQGSYRIRIQIITTNDRKLGWDDENIVLGGADQFLLLEGQEVRVDSIDPLTKEHNTAWPPLYGVNVDPSSRVALATTMKNIGTKTASGTISVSTKRLLYANEEPVMTTGGQVSIEAGSSKEIQVPVTTPKNSGAYIILVMVKDVSGQAISSVAEYRYVVRGQSASIASAQIHSIPASEGALAEVTFVLGGSADRNTLVEGIMQVDITDANGTVGTITKDFLIPAAIPATGSAFITIQRTVCGTPHLTITLKNKEGVELAQDSLDAPAFANPSCKKPFFSFVNRTVANIFIGIVMVVVLVLLYIVKVKQKSPKKRSK